MIRILQCLILAAAAIAGCEPSPHTKFAGTATNANPVVVVDGPNQGANILGVASNPLFVTSTGEADSGVAQVDTTPGSLLNTLVTQNVPAVQQVLIDAGTRCITDINYTNEGTITGYAQVFCGQYVTDAGGTAGAATVPSLQLRCPAGTVCGIKLEAPLCCAGATWYSGVDAGFLLQTSAPALTLTAASLR